MVGVDVFFIVIAVVHGQALLCRYTIYKDHITLSDYEINDGMSLEMY